MGGAGRSGGRGWEVTRWVGLGWQHGYDGTVSFPGPLGTGMVLLCCCCCCCEVHCCDSLLRAQDRLTGLWVVAVNSQAGLGIKV